MVLGRILDWFAGAPPPEKEKPIVTRLTKEEAFAIGNAALEKANEEGPLGWATPVRRDGRVEWELAVAGYGAVVEVSLDDATGEVIAIFRRDTR